MPNFNFAEALNFKSPAISVLTARPGSLQKPNYTLIEQMRQGYVLGFFGSRDSGLVTRYRVTAARHPKGRADELQTAFLFRQRS
jgi:hypothetical protein